MTTTPLAPPRHPAGLLLALLALLALPVQAQQRPAPGLWEHQMTMGGPGGQVAPEMAEMQRQMAAMPAEQRKQMEAMMAARGIQLGAAGGTGITVKHCLTPEQAARDELPQHDPNCRQTRMERSGNRIRFAFACTGRPGGSGEGEFVMHGDKAYDGRMTMLAAAGAPGDAPRQVEMSMKARWLAADCGGVAPRR